ncbi:tight adherence protein E [Actinobacillus equuli]|nr:tight adherence protein E [Actinobacillus equuli]
MYAPNLDDLVHQKFQTNASGVAFAQYTFQYRYKPLFFWVPGAAVEPLFNRKIVVLQEYEKIKQFLTNPRGSVTVEFIFIFFLFRCC